MDSSVIGKTIGRYKIVEHLGRGGMAEVYKAYQPSLDRYVAIKLMHTFLAEDPDFFSRFTREAKNVGALRHPNIVQIHDFDHDGSTYYMVMEFIDGGPLKNRLEEYAAQGQRLPLAEAIRIIQDVGAALSYAHKRNMIHRDIKPANVMLDSTGRVILTDFGIAKLLSGVKYTASGALMGTPSYMAPEQGLGQPGDARADIYSLGVMFYQLVTGRLPFEADTPIGVILKHVNEPLPLPRAINPDLPQSVENIILKATAKDPAERYQSVDDMLAHLKNLPSAEHIELPTSKTLIGDKGVIAMSSMRATVREAPINDSAAPAVSSMRATVRSPGTQTAPAAAPARTGFNPWPLIIAGLLALLLVGGVAAAAIFGPRLFALTGTQPTDFPAPTNTAAPTDTPAPVGTPTTDPVLVALTENAAVIATLRATPPDTPTPDHTATFVACVFDSALVSQDPKDGASFAVGSTTTITLEIENTGQCAWDDQTVFFLDSSTSIPLAAAEPGQRVSVVLKATPNVAGTNTSTWFVKLANGRDVGKPIVLTYKAAVAATAAPRASSTPTATPTSAASPTSSGGGAISGANPTFYSCTYITNTTDFQCLTSIGVGGGVSPYTITIDGLAEMTGTHTAANPYFFQLRGRRCIERLFSFRVVDSIGQVFNGNGSFRPKETKLFNNNTEVCGDG